MMVLKSMAQNWDIEEEGIVRGLLNRCPASTLGVGLARQYPARRTNRLWLLPCLTTWLLSLGGDLESIGRLCVIVRIVEVDRWAFWSKVVLSIEGPCNWTT
jgi:hypothetical protein